MFPYNLLKLLGLASVGCVTKYILFQRYVYREGDYEGMEGVESILEEQKKSQQMSNMSLGGYEQAPRF